MKIAPLKGVFVSGAIKDKTLLGKCHRALQEIFEKDLRAKLENLGSVHFVESSPCRKGRYPANLLMNIYRKPDGSIHCITFEEPDFEKWA